MSAAIVSTIAVIAALGATAIVLLSARLRSEIVELFEAFTRAERELAPRVATVQTDRERLAARVSQLTDPGGEPTRR
jgi:hypothetical protein